MKLFSILSVERYYNHEWHLEKKLQLKRQLVRKFEQLEGKSSNKEEERERGRGWGMREMLLLYIVGPSLY